MCVGIIAASNIRFSPYIFFYTQILDELQFEYELIYPDRVGVSDVFSKQTHKIEWRKDIPTTYAYLLYSKSVISIVKEKKYDFLIVLTGNNAAFLSVWLQRNYKGKYIIDIRDYTHENILPYFWLEAAAIRNSATCVISSKKFEMFLPQWDYCVCHNISAVEENYSWRFMRSPAPIVIGYIGKGGYIQECKELCALIQKDKRFIMHIHGLKNIPEELMPFADCNNIQIYGLFDPSQKKEIIESVDILFNVYGNGTPLLDYALSNKLYDSLRYLKPILTSPGTYMSEMAGPLSFEVDFLKKDLLEELYQWYCNLDERSIEEYAKKKLLEILQENSETRRIITKALMSHVKE